MSLLWMTDGLDAQQPIYGYGMTWMKKGSGLGLPNTGQGLGLPYTNQGDGIIEDLTEIIKKPKLNKNTKISLSKQSKRILKDLLA